MQAQIEYNQDVVNPKGLNFRRRLAYSILRLCGWKTLYSFRPTQLKYVVIQAPHTSNWDFIWGKLWNFVVEMDVKVLIKKSLFFWPLGPILRALGGVPVDRANRKDRKTDNLLELFNQNEKFILAITPEGTRSRNPNWKTGFYHIAVKAQVPILIGIIDYKTRSIGTFALFHPTGEFQSDFRQIRNLYAGAGAKHPQKFSIGNDLENTV
jgi:1-acyl-sn-glycerol-3-phosphate acyltransferase